MSLTPEDLIIYNDNENGMMAGGFKINTIYDSISPVNSFKGQKGGSSSILNNVFSDLAVPAGLFYAQQNFPVTKKYETKNIDKSITDTIHDRLLKLVSPKKRFNHNIQTRKRKKKEKHKTRKKG